MLIITDLGQVTATIWVPTSCNKLSNAAHDRVMEWTSVENMRLNTYEYINGVDISFIRCTMKYTAGCLSKIEEIRYMIKHRNSQNIAHN